MPFLLHPRRRACVEGFPQPGAATGSALEGAAPHGSTRGIAGPRDRRRLLTRRAATEQAQAPAVEEEAGAEPWTAEGPAALTRAVRRPPRPASVPQSAANATTAGSAASGVAASGAGPSILDEPLPDWVQLGELRERWQEDLEANQAKVAELNEGPPSRLDFVLLGDSITAFNRR